MIYSRLYLYLSSYDKLLVFYLLNVCIEEIKTSKHQRKINRSYCNFTKIIKRLVISFQFSL